jgi:hypothetical protein
MADQRRRSTRFAGCRPPDSASRFPASRSAGCATGESPLAGDVTEEPAWRSSRSCRRRIARSASSPAWDRRCRALRFSPAPCCTTRRCSPAASRLPRRRFEAIHPFRDANGRVGRLLVAALLVEWKLLPGPLLDFSTDTERRRDEYYPRLLTVSTDGDWTGWITFFLTVVANQAADAAARVARCSSCATATASRSPRHDCRACYPRWSTRSSSTRPSRSATSAKSSTCRTGPRR